MPLHETILILATELLRELWPLYAALIVLIGIGLVWQGWEGRGEPGRAGEETPGRPG